MPRHLSDLAGHRWGTSVSAHAAWHAGSEHRRQSRFRHLGDLPDALGGPDMPREHIGHPNRLPPPGTPCMVETSAHEEVRSVAFRIGVATVRSCIAAKMGPLRGLDSRDRAMSVASYRSGLLIVGLGLRRMAHVAACGVNDDAGIRWSSRAWTGGSEPMIVSKQVRSST